MPRTPTFQISLYLTNRAALLVGSGPIAENRDQRLRAAGATVTWVSADDYRSDMCAHKFLVAAADDDETCNERVAADALAAGCLRYVHDRPALSDFAMPALIKRGPLTLAISTDGAAPALSRVVRERLEQLIASGGDELDQLIAELEALRQSLPKGQRGPELYRLASRFRIDGTLAIEPAAESESD